MRKFAAIKIIHNIIDRLDFSFFAEFFRYTGIFVGEDTVFSFDPEDENNKECFDVFFYTGNRSLIEGVKETEKFEELQDFQSKIEQLADGSVNLMDKVRQLPPQIICIRDFLPDDLLEVEKVNNNHFPQPVYAIINNNELCDLIKYYLMEIYKLLLPEETFENVKTIVNEFLALIRIFIDYRLWMHSMNLQYYPNRKTKPVEEAKAAFLKAYEGLCSAVDRCENAIVKSHCKYAMLWCAVKVNSADAFSDQVLTFSTTELADRCQNFCKEYPDFVNAKVLLGLCYENAAGSAIEAVNAYKDAAERLKDKCYSTAVYYWIGKRYESYEAHKKDAEENYRKAYELRPKFRNIFKVAIYNRNNGDYAEAIRKFDEILQKLQLSISINYSDPLELEYAFKSYSQKCYIYFQKVEDDIKVIENGEAAIRVRESMIDKNRYYDIFYLNEAEDYRKLSKDRMDLKNIYWMLAVAYGKIMEIEKSDMYWSRVRESER